MDDRVADAYTGFGFDLLKQLVKQQSGENVFISPSSVAFALAMTYNGAAGATQEAMGGALDVEGMQLKDLNDPNATWRLWLTNPGPGVELSVANSIWVRDGVEIMPGFLERNRQSYDADVANVDFSKDAAAEAINKWVSDNTRDKIPDIVQPPIDAETVIFLVNAVYFNGKWKAPFDPKRTADGTFIRADGSSVTVPMMSGDAEYRTYKGDRFLAVALPYGEGRMSMYIFLPDQNSDVATFVQGLNEADRAAWMAGFQEGRINLTMPKFDLEYEASLKEPLTAMGMGIAFDSTKADFAQMLSRDSLGGENAYINSVKHKTALEVTEEGTTAAGATSVEIGVTSMPPSFVVDRPFVTAIVDSATGTVLFIGVIADPS